MSKTPIIRYPGKAADITWDERLCIHIGECGRAKGDLFVAGRDPWCQPDVANVAEVVDVCERCPSGALTYEVKDGSTVEQPVAANTVTVSYNGPLFVRGDLAIDGAPADMPSVRFRAALCRCGQSKRKPFCDNSHEAVAFKDYGAVGEAGTAATAAGGSLAIKPLKDGPLQVKGNLTIVASSGYARWQGDETYLCRCGASKNKPFCDGSHRAAGFKSS